MKKLIAVFSFVAFVLFSGQLFAQVTFSAGLRAGINSADMEFESSFEDDEVSFANRVGLYLGVPVEIRFSNAFALQPELNFIQKGVQIDFSEQGSSFREEAEGEITLNYLELPVLAKLTAGNESFQMFAVAGPRISMALDGEFSQDYRYFQNDELIEEESGSIPIPIGSEGDDGPGANRFDFGMTFGLGASVKAGAGRLMIDARYDLGLSNWNFDAMDGEDEIFNRGVGVTLGYLMPLGGN